MPKRLGEIYDEWSSEENRKTNCLSNNNTWYDNYYQKERKCN